MRTLTELMALPGRRALISGGAGHVAHAAAEALVELGATVAIADRDEAACRARADALSRARAGSALALPCDLADSRATREVVCEATERMGGLDIVVHSAAFLGSTTYPGWAVRFEEQTVDAWEAALRVDLTAGFVLAQAAYPFLAASGRGAVCFLSSIYGIVGPDMRLYEGTLMSNPAGYAASKGGMIQMTRYLAAVMGPLVRVNCVSPGGIFREQPQAFVDRYQARTPLRRMATEEDLKGAIAYLVSDLSAYVTGHNLVVDGGWTIW